MLQSTTKIGVEVEKLKISDVITFHALWTIRRNFFSLADSPYYYWLYFQPLDSHKNLDKLSPMRVVSAVLTVVAIIVLFHILELQNLLL